MTKERDRDLIKRFQVGDEEALEALYELYKPLIYQRLSRFENGYHEHQDYLQEARIALYQAAENFDLERPWAFAPFLRRVIDNRLIDKLRQDNSQQQLLFRAALQSNQAEEEVEYPDTAGDPEEILLETESLAQLLDFMSAELSDYEAKVAKQKLDGKTYREIALILGAKEKSVDAALQRVRRKLRQFQERTKD
ncbi:MAG: sigma-70 family RNA polymerase sigma factor [Eubacteriales bacterium]|nr:sigma-70 family RNA polymerase sigma factor [Eubacteriales bacterium]